MPLLKSTPSSESSERLSPLLFLLLPQALHENCAKAVDTHPAWWSCSSQLGALRVWGSITTHVDQGNGAYHGSSRCAGVTGALQMPRPPVSLCPSVPPSKCLRNTAWALFFLEFPLPPTPLYLTRSSSWFKTQFTDHQVSEPFPNYSLQLVSCPPLCFHSILYWCQKPPDMLYYAYCIWIF